MEGVYEEGEILVRWGFFAFIVITWVPDVVFSMNLQMNPTYL